MGPAGNSLPGGCVGVGGNAISGWKPECDVKTGIPSKTETKVKFIREQIFHPIFHIPPLQKATSN